MLGENDENEDIVQVENGSHQMDFENHGNHRYQLRDRNALKPPDFLSLETEVENPQTYHEALETYEHEKWFEAMGGGIQALKK
ncbi:hypothetical protein JTB14_007958 [Gonioctena quinquepunctata]|nr:hypothetical protein JTB14_007958 [Gonioctena quinquepunctata]